MNVIAIDFAKVFDSVNRVALLGALTAYGYDPAMIDIVVELYTNNYTEIYRVILRLDKWRCKMVYGRDVRGHHSCFC